MVRFLHTADLQLGMRRRYLDADAQARFGDARVQVIRTIGGLASELDAAFVVVAGDVFESNQVDRRTVWRALDAFGSVPVPVLLLPGNHDPLQPGSLYRSVAFRDRQPGNVRVLADTAPVEVVPGVQVVGAPWRTKRPLSDLAGDAVADLPPAGSGVRILVAHGATDDLHPDRVADPAAIRVASLEAALETGRIHAVCLGDRHSTTAVGATGRIWYSGAPEPTDVVEEAPGQVLAFDLDGEGCDVTAHQVGTWRFADIAVELLDDDDVDALAARLDAMEDRDRTVAVLRWAGTVSVRGRARLDDVLAEAAEVFGAVEVRDQHCDLAVVPDDHDLTGLHGFAQWTVDDLRARLDGDDAGMAADALALLHRLSGGAA